MDVCLIIPRLYTQESSWRGSGMRPNRTCNFLLMLAVHASGLKPSSPALTASHAHEIVSLPDEFTNPRYIYIIFFL